MTIPSYPLLYQLNARIRQYELSRAAISPPPLNDWPDSEWDRLAELGFDWVWLLGVWETGKAGQRVSRTQPGWQKSFKATCLPDLSETDICGSCFAITRYQVADRLGGNKALQHLRHKLNERGLRLMLDFVPNHTALDHPWMQTHPEFYINGTREDLQRNPQNYVALVSNSSGKDQRIFAYGRDPYFDGWPDTLQLDYSNPAVQQAMQVELLNIAKLCDGVRCDMAMLLLPQIFERTWQRSITSFWPATIQAVRKQFPGFLFLAEVYWDLEWMLQQQGFDYTYDKRLYDRLLSQVPKPVHDHLTADITYQRKLARFLENHDEQRAATVFPPTVHEAAAMINYLAPGMRFFQAGQLEGKRVHIPIHLCRSPVEPTDSRLSHFYQQLLQILKNPVLRQGNWVLLECLPAQKENGTWNNFIAYRWQGENSDSLLIIVNYAPHPGQCLVEFADLQPKESTGSWHDLMNPSESLPVRIENITQLFVDLPAWGYRILEKQP
ncbi:alpha-amylase family glycosyl hydrolase [Nitrosomonas eutropha]|uniref:Alpha amylase catalytic subunit n=2 Tax=Nitrosomonas eutropha TaxID=916 RepID=A0ABX5M6S9_9PROT|nr:alpha-amylase family glycosyl hydrolase [Nitrosomonas eutropha]ABI59248.1 alpha amylase, catalytic region [Nitrosomonas eutropha C91]PXV81026.1 alpha amylase catalytic subunit [Nitrosomonas eutropha]SEJ21281.1 Alpha amylase, catalytic domain [Nitrosomonas eutropha]